MWPRPDNPRRRQVASIATAISSAPSCWPCSIKRKSSPYAYRKGPDLYVAIQGWHRLVLPKHTDVAAKLADMDAAGIEKTALSVNDPGPELFANDG